MNVDSWSPIRLAISKDNGENWELQVELDNEKGSVHNAGHEYSYPSCVPWPAKEYGEEGVSVTYTWHRRRGIFLGKFEGTFENGQAERPIIDLMIIK